VGFRNDNGAFPSREVLRKVPGMGERPFSRQRAFLRIPGAAIRWTIPRCIRSAMSGHGNGAIRGADIKEFIGNAHTIRGIERKNSFPGQSAFPTIDDIWRRAGKSRPATRAATFTYAHFTGTSANCRT